MPSWSQQLCAETTATSKTVAVSLAATNPPAIGSIATEKVSRKTIIVRIPIMDRFFATYVFQAWPRVKSKFRERHKGRSKKIGFISKSLIFR